MCKILNRRGSKMLSVYWFAILFIVAAAIVYMVYSFYGQPYDIRGAEANALASRFVDCVSQGGHVAEGVLVEGILDEGFKENFLDICNLNFEVEDAFGWKDSGQFYFEANFFDFNSGAEIGGLSEGNLNLKDFCGKEGNTLPVCVERSFYLVDEEEPQGQYKINVISIVRKTEKNAR